MKALAIRKIIVCVFLLLGLTEDFFATNLLRETIVYDFSDNWLRYDKYYESYLPLKRSELKGARSIHQIINYRKYKKYDLQFQAEKGLTLFVNNKLIYKKAKGESETVKLALENLQTDNEDQMILTFFNPSGDLPFYSTRIISIGSLSVEQKEKAGPTALLKARVGRELSYYLLLFVGIATLFVIFKRIYPKEYVRYFSFSFQESADHLLPGSFSIPSLWMALISGLAIALLVNMLGLTDTIFSSEFTFVKSTIMITSGYFLFYIGKYLYLWMVAWLFNYSKVVPPQFAEYMRFLERVCLLFCLIVFGFITSGFFYVNIKPEILYFSLIMVLIFCVVKVIFLFFRLISHRNLYLFSYLCAAEILPLIIAVKILLF